MSAATPEPIDLQALWIAWSNTLANDTWPDNNNEFMLLKAIPQLLADLATLRARVEAVEAERDNDKAAFDAMRPFVAQIEQTIASAAEQIQQAEAVASEIAAERDRLVSALAGVREALAQIMYYATHQRWCQFNTSGDQQLCDCGFRTAYLAALPPGGGDTP